MSCVLLTLAADYLSTSTVLSSCCSSYKTVTSQHCLQFLLLPKILFGLIMPDDFGPKLELVRQLQAL